MKTLEELVKKIEKSNKAFEAMSPAEKRVAIARDAIERIKLGNVNPNRGYLLRNVIHFIETSKDMKTIVNEESCTVCAKGGLFVSYVGRVNNFNTCDLDDDSECKTSRPMKKLLELFTREQLDGIEVAFEEQSYSWTITGHREFINNCRSYQLNCKISSSYDAMLSICKNIIKNKGEFVPTDYVDPKARIK